MNETATATSTTSPGSAAAVADSARAVATSKTAADSVAASVTAASNAAAAVTTTTAKSTSVKLLIKASNQQYDDQFLDIDLQWTVKRLKAHLAQVYPNKPPVDEQKLIYSGQLLNNNLLLKDVIRSYKDVYTQNHIIHLVYTPKNTLNTITKQKSKSNNTTNMSPSGNNSDGLRQRHTTNNSSTATARNAAQSNLQNLYYQQYQQHQQQQQSNFVYSPFNQQCPVYDPNNPQNALPFNMQTVAQQAAMYNWMQQVYSQYMEQCIRMANTSATASGMPTTNTGNQNPVNFAAPGVNPFGFNPFLQQLPFLTPTTTATGVNNPVISTTVANGNTAVQAVAPGEQAQQGQAQPQRQPAAPAPRFPNIVQEEQENRDWLDSFFSITRLAIFLTILYLNSSPLRCLAVVIIAGCIYLYHIGVLRIRTERNNNNINRNNNAADADQIRRGVRQIQQAARADEQRNPQNDNSNDGAAATDAAAVDGENVNAAAAAELSTSNTNAGTAAIAGEAATAVATDANENNEINNAASVISVLRTFVVTFFTSLLPETPTL